MIPLEDNASDIIGKAQRGLGISDSELANKAGLSAQTIRKLRDGDFDESALLSVAPVLAWTAGTRNCQRRMASKENRIVGRARSIHHRL
jgi:predicted transcriptional regulator